MNRDACVREDELLDALARGYVHDELAEHVTRCASCEELRLTAGALLGDRADALREAAVPSSAAMWWRMQLRLKQDVEAAARRSLRIGQGATLAVALVLIALVFGHDLAISAKQMLATAKFTTPLVIAFATTLLLAPLAGWVAIRSK